MTPTRMPPEPPSTTRELLSRTQHGDRNALDELLTRYHDRVAGMVRVRLGPDLRRDVDTRDVVQHVLLHLVEHVDRVDPSDDASLTCYLATQVHRRILDLVRQQRTAKRGGGREPIPLSPGDGRPPLELPAAITPPLERLVRDEARDVIEICLLELPEPQRELILLRGYAGHGFAEIARLRDLPSEDAARVAYARALVRLGDKLRRRLPRNETQGRTGA